METIHPDALTRLLEDIGFSEGEIEAILAEPPKGKETARDGATSVLDHPDAWVPVSEIIGTDSVPEPAAAVIRAAIEKMRDAGEIGEKNLWQALEYWAADYLAGE
jgi:hypothetical protein